MRSDNKLRVKEGNAVPRTVELGRCPICESEGAGLFFEGPDRWLGVRGWFVYRECSVCRTVYQDPQVVSEDLSLCYPAEYYTHAPVENVVPVRDAVGKRKISRLRDQLRRSIIASVQGMPIGGVSGGCGRILSRIRSIRERAYWGTLDELIPRSAENRRALEVGCGAGFLLSELKNIGWEIEGVEIDPRAAEAARRNSGCFIRTGDFRDLDLPRSSFELIVMHHVFEHLSDPVGALKAIAELLAYSGSAVLIYPNRDALGARIFRRHWIHWDSPRHLVMAPGSALADAASRAGLTCISVRTTVRWAAKGFALSRAFRAGQTHTEVKGIDRLLEFTERTMARCGLKVGEEIIVALRRSSNSGINV